MQKAASSVFQRMRIVDLLLLHEEEARACDENIVLLRLARDIVSGVQADRQSHIKDFPRNKDLLTSEDGWHELFDVSEEALQDAIRWYRILREYQGFGAGKFLSELLKKLYSMRKQETTESYLGSGNSFGDIVIGTMADTQYMAQGISVGDEDMQQGLAKLQQSFNTFQEGLMLLRDEFDMVYSSITVS